MRPRKKDRHLPAGMYRRHGAYYLVRRGKWTRLGAGLREALDLYYRMAHKSEESMPALLDTMLVDAKKRVSPNTYRQYRAAVDKLKAAFAEFSATQVKPRHIMEMMDHHKGTPNMANRMLVCLRLAFPIAIRKGWCDTNPAQHVQRLPEAKRDRLLSDDEYRRIWKAANPTLRATMDMAYLTGQRIGDVLKIRLSDITEEGIQFAQQKTGKKLCVAMSPDLKRAVEAAKSLHGNTPRMYLLGTRKGRVRSYEGVRDLWDRAKAVAGVENTTLHDLRAKSLTDAKRQGKDPKALAGHTQESTTNRYLRDKEIQVVEGPSIGQTG